MKLKVDVRKVKKGHDLASKAIQEWKGFTPGQKIKNFEKIFLAMARAVDTIESAITMPEPEEEPETDEDDRNQEEH